MVLGGIDWALLVQLFLFLVFADLTAFVAAVLGPTYDGLLVPELRTGALYPAENAASPSAGNFLAPAAHFSTYLLANVVDPAIALIALGVAVLYLSKAAIARWGAAAEALVPRLVIAVVGANFAVPIAGAILTVAGSLYPVVSDWDGGAWQQWTNLAGIGEYRLSWDNGAVAFVLALVEFALVFALVLAIGVRDALLAVLLVLLPIVTLLWPFRPLAAWAQRTWLLFAELAFLPCVLVVPLELAVGSPTPVMLIAYLAVALGSPFLLSVSGTRLAAFGFPGAGALAGATDRSLGSAPGAATAVASPATGALRNQGAWGRAAAGTVRAAGSASTPAAPPLAAAELLGHGAVHLARHLHRTNGSSGPPGSLPAVRPGGGR